MPIEQKVVYYVIANDGVINKRTSRKIRHLACDPLFPKMDCFRKRRRKHIIHPV